MLSHTKMIVNKPMLLRWRSTDVVISIFIAIIKLHILSKTFHINCQKHCYSYQKLNYGLIWCERVLHSNTNFFLCVYNVENCSFFLFILGILNQKIALELLTHGRLAVLSCVALFNHFFPFTARNEIKTVRFGLKK